MARQEAPPGLTVSLSYQSGEVERTLVANGRIVVKRDGSGTDSRIEGARWAHTQVSMGDARALSPAASLDVQGFELRHAPTSMVREQFYDEGHLFSQYFDECAKLVKAATGASIVKVFDYNLRSASLSQAKQRIEGGEVVVQPPAQLVHNDYTLTLGPARLRQLGAPPKFNDVSRRLQGDTPLLSDEEVELGLGGRFSIVNVWRNVRDDPVQVFPLGCCDARSISPEDLCVFEIHYADRVGENYFAAHGPQHKWYYYPRMAHDEALLIKQWDSSGNLAGEGPSTFSLHTAFHDPSAAADAPDRESIEVRCLCIFGADAACADAAKPHARL